MKRVLFPLAMLFLVMGLFVAVPVWADGSNNVLVDNQNINTSNANSSSASAAFANGGTAYGGSATAGFNANIGVNPEISNSLSNSNVFNPESVPSSNRGRASLMLRFLMSAQWGRLIRVFIILVPPLWNFP